MSSTSTRADAPVVRAVHRGTDQHLLREDRSSWSRNDALEALMAELGDAVVGQPFERPGSDAAALVTESPCSNVAERFANDVFAIRAFCWCGEGEHVDEDDPYSNEFHHCPPNFHHFASGLRGEWYKHLGRDTYFSDEPADVARIREECLASIGR